MAKGQYAIEFTARRWRWYPMWLPFGSVTITIESPPGYEWQRAYDFAMQFAETGAKNVSIWPIDSKVAGAISETEVA